MNQASLPDSRRRLVVLGLPALALALGAWQLQRGWSGLVSMAQEATSLAAQAGQMDAIAAVTPTRIVQFSGNPQAYGAQLAATMMHDGLSLLQWEVLTDRVRVGLALATLLGGAVSLLAGATGLTAAAWAARRSRQSRDALEAAFTRIRALLPFLLGSLVGGLAVACSAALVFELAGWLFSTSGSRTEIRILTPGFVLAGAVLWLGWLTVRELRRSLAAFTPSPLTLLGREVASNEAPGLWQFVAARAAEQSAAMPDHVAVGLVDGFFVTSADVALGPGATLLRGRTLHVSLPMLAMLDAGETAAIIGHELAHLATDTGYDMRFLPIYTGIERNLEALHAVRDQSTLAWTQGPAITLGTYMMSVFDGAVKHWSRLREIEADRAGAQHSGAEPAARALIRTALLQPAIDAVLAEAWQAPGAASPDLVATIVARAGAAGLGDPASALEERQPHPIDSHPPSSQRLGALGLDVTALLLAQASRSVQPEGAVFARGLFSNWAALCSAVSADAIGVAASNRAARTARLRETAGQVTEAVVEILSDWRKTAAAWGTAASVFLGAGLLLAYWLVFLTVSDPAHIPLFWLLVAGLLAIGAACVLRGILLWRGRNTPLITLSAEGFLCRGLDRMVPWIGVERLNMTRQHSTHVFIHLMETTKLPKRVSGWGVVVSARRRVVTMLGVRPRGLSPDGFAELIQRYWTAACARAALAGEAEPGYSMILAEEELQKLLASDNP
ncbi:MAG: M48 family metalloprotease [Janthinobacterium lividum]